MNLYVVFSIPYKNFLPQNILPCHHSYTVFTHHGFFLISVYPLNYVKSGMSQVVANQGSSLRRQQGSPSVKCNSVKFPLYQFSAHFIAS